LVVDKQHTLEAIASALSFSSLMSASLIAVLIYFKEAINYQFIKKISKTNHTVVFGLGKYSSTLLENELDNNNTNYIIFEKDINNDRIEYFQKAGMGMVQGNALDNDNLEQLNFETMDFALITMEDDKLNLEFALTIIDYYLEQKISTPIKLVIHLANSDLGTVFHQKFMALEQSSSNNIDIKIFSFYEEVSNLFFSRYCIDGINTKLINSSEDYHIVLVGNGDLALNLIYQIAIRSALPNENKLYIHLVDKQATQFKDYVVKKYFGVEKVVTLVAHDIDYKTYKFFLNESESVWRLYNLTHVIVCYDQDETNIDIAVDLYDKTYLKDIVENKLSPIVSFAVFNASKLSEKFNIKQEGMSSFQTFGDTKDVLTRENIFDEQYDLIAKLIHYGYAETYNPNVIYDLNDYEVKQKIEKKWFDSSRLSDKLSSKAQSRHIDIKLKAMGLTRIQSSDTPENLLSENRKIFDNTLAEDFKHLGLSKDVIHKYSEELPKLWDDVQKEKSPIKIVYFPKTYDTLFEKLIRAEHNRWNAFHYLNGWTYNKIKSKEKKEHDCLLPLNDFIDPKLQLTVIYDMYAILYIPNYLANAGYKIIRREKNNVLCFV
jgi:hypothetical protein